MPWDEHAGERFKRAVILGDPGFGKTWLLRYEARRLASPAAQALNDHRITLDDLTLPIFTPLSALSRWLHEHLHQVEKDEDPIEEALIALLGKGRSVAFAQWLRARLRTERCVILLDALDEVPIEGSDEHISRQSLKEKLEAFALEFTQPRILLTSRIVGYFGSPIPNAQELELIAFETPQIESFTRVWFGAGTEKAQQFLATLRQNYQVRGLARIPLMLALLCRAYQADQLTFPTRRVALYDRCLRGLLQDWKEEKEQRSVNVEAMLELLQAVGFALFVAGKEQFKDAELREAIMNWLATLPLNHEFARQDATSLIEALKVDGILITVGESLIFLHRTFHEYLTACELAARVNPKPNTNDLLNPPTEAQKKREARRRWKTIARFVNEKASVPEWGEVIVLLSGSLHDATPLLKLLTNPKYDDLFRHRLCLAAQCLPELARASRSELEKAIANEVVKLWLKYHERDIHFQHITRCQRAAIQSCPDTPLLEALRNEDEYVRSRAAYALGRLGAGTPEVVAGLLAALRDEERFVRKYAAYALEELMAQGVRISNQISLRIRINLYCWRMVLRKNRYFYFLRMAFSDLPFKLQMKFSALPVRLQEVILYGVLCSASIVGWLLYLYLFK